MYRFLPLLAALAVAIILSACGSSPSVEKNIAGFDEYGYNDVADIFNGAADGVDRNLDGAVWGATTYANDHLVMKWSKAWEEGNALDDEFGYSDSHWDPKAWTDNEWNGQVEGGSGEVWHYKIVWVGSAGEDSVYWRDGGYLIWDNFEVVMDQGTGYPDDGHTWFARAVPNGYGSN